MKITISAKNFKVTQEIREYLENRMSKLDKFFNRIIEAQVFLRQEKFRYTAEAKILVYGISFNSREVSNDMRVSIDTMVSKLEAQLKKHKSKVKSHKMKELDEGLIKPQPELYEDEEGEETDEYSQATQIRD